MNNLKFQFRYNDQSGGLYIWADSTLLTKDIADKLAKLVITLSFLSINNSAWLNKNSLVI